MLHNSLKFYAVPLQPTSTAEMDIRLSFFLYKRLYKSTDDQKIN